MSAEGLDEAADEIEQAEVSTGRRRFAFIYLAVLFFGLLTAIGGFVYLGYVDLNITIGLDMEIGWIAEYFVVGVALLFLVFTGLMVMSAAGTSLTAGAIRAVARAADSYELPEDTPRSGEDNEGEDSG